MAGEGWNVMRFDRCACLVRDIVNPCDVRGLPYIGLEHIAEGQLALAGHGSADQVTSVKSRFRKGDILFGKLRPYFRKVVIAPFDGICSTDIWVVRRKQGIDQRYLFYWMATHEFIEESTRASEGTKMPRAQWDFVGRIEKLVPPIKEQQAIACILGALDDKIELNRRMNQTLEAMARAIFKSWFVDFDPVRAKAAVRREHPRWTDEQVSRAACPKLKPEIAALFPDSFEPSELGEIPKGWRVDSLDGIANYLNGLALQKYPPKNAGTLPVIKIAQLRKGDSYGADLCSANLPTDYIIQDGDVLFSWSGSLEVEIWCGGAGALNQHLFKVTSHRFKKWFFFLWTLHHLNDFRLIAADKATTMGHIQRKHLSDARVLIPSKPLMDSMDNLMDPLVERVVSCRLESRTLAALRDTLLPKLISGELRVPDVERIAGRCL